MSSRALLDDAVLLRRSRRYRRSIALATLCIEESAKLAVVHPAFDWWVGSSANSRANRHLHKQRVAGQLVMGALLIDQVIALATIAGVNIDSLYPEDPSEPASKPFAEVLQKMDPIEIRMLDERTLRGARQIALIVHLLKGDFESIRQACFYGDAQLRQGLVELLEPGQIRESCDRILRMAHAALYSLELKLASYANRRGCR